MSDFDNVNNSDSFDELFENIGYRFDESLDSGWERIAQSVKDIYHKTTDKLEDENPGKHIFERLKNRLMFFKTWERLHCKTYEIKNDDDNDSDTKRPVIE